MKNIIQKIADFFMGKIATAQQVQPKEPIATFVFSRFEVQGSFLCAKNTEGDYSMSINLQLNKVLKSSRIKLPNNSALYHVQFDGDKNAIFCFFANGQKQDNLLAGIFGKGSSVYSFN